MKRSKTITLSLLATLSLTLGGCSSQQSTKREIYQTKQDCLEDWGTEESCEEDKTNRVYHGPHYFYRGGYPYYFRSGMDDPMPVDRRARFSSVPEGGQSMKSAGSLSSARTIRGGFGRASSFHGFGG